MTRNEISRIRKTVYVVGAGFSAGLGYPLTKSLLIDVWDQLPSTSRDRLRQIIEFHHPFFDSSRTTTFPDIEQLLTEMAVNAQMFDASRPAEGKFTKKELEDARQVLLSTIAAWFHEIYDHAQNSQWLPKIVAKLRRENAAIVSFNWDLILDHLLFQEQFDSQTYGLTTALGVGPVLLKPHGSLNWYEGTQLNHVADLKRIEIFHHEEESKCVHAFLPPRGVITKSGKRYSPLIIPPTHLKDFSPSIFQQLWKNCTDVLSTPRRIVFLGYSLPSADIHAQFIFRCGFHNQFNGRLRDDGGRYPSTGAAEVVIVNPDQEAARRIESVVGPRIRCTWIPKRLDQWLEKEQ